MALVTAFRVQGLARGTHTWKPPRQAALPGSPVPGLLRWPSRAASTSSCFFLCSL